MKKIKIFLTAFCLGSVLLTGGCDSFLDRQEDESLTFDKVWETYTSTREYWYTTMMNIPNYASEFNYDPYIAFSDEGCGALTFSRPWNYLISGAWNPSESNYVGNYADKWKNRYYRSIRECNIFLANVDRCQDELLTETERGIWKAQTKFARAYYYFLIMQNYGPVFILEDEILDFTLSAAELERPRNTWEECVDYVCGEFEALTQDPYMSTTFANDADKGLGTKGACLAFIARLKLYSARDLYNGNTMYASMKNPDGTNLFPQTYDANKWKEAAEAAYEVLRLGAYSLYRHSSNDPYANYYGITQENWNQELIYSRYNTRYYIGVHVRPTSVKGVNAWGNMGVTQQQVDAYGMAATGRFPITGYNTDGSPIVDPQSGYPSAADELTLDAMTYPAWGGDNAYTIQRVPKMYAGRDPRFYVTVFFSNSYWVSGSNRELTSFAFGANGNTSDARPLSGYMLSKVYDHTLLPTQGEGTITYPIIRLGEVYLNFIESVLECKKRGVSMPGTYETMAFDLWDELRDRSGMPPIMNAYPSATTEELIELCRRERRVELAFENHRYFDTRTWKIAEQTDGGPMWGMDINVPGSGDETPDEFWKRTIFQRRVFEKKHYLWPFEQREVELNKQLVQNYGW